MIKRILTAAAAVAVLAAGASGAMAQSESIQFDLRNSTSATLTYLYISDPGEESWEEDILGNQVAEAGETVQVTIDDGLPGCEYDLRAEFDDGDTLEVYGADLCGGGTITIR